MKKVNEEVIGVLSMCSIEGNLLRFPEKLDRKLYELTAKVLKAVGGKWNSARQAYVFREDIGDTLEDIINTGTVSDVRKEFQFFPTPDELARRIVEMAQIRPGDRLLEPSAGTGNIARYMPGCDVIELQEPNRRELERQGFNVVGTDFMTFVPEHGYDVIVMNPPFSKGQDAAHITKAIGIARRTVIAVASASVMWHSGKRYQEFRELVWKFGGTIEPLPEKSFAPSGTMVNTCLVKVFR